MKKSDWHLFELLWICEENGILHPDKANKSLEGHVSIGTILVQHSRVFKDNLFPMQQPLAVTKVPFSKEELI